MSNRYTPPPSSGSGGSGIPQGGPLTQDLDYNGFAAENVGTMTAAYIVGVSGGNTSLDGGLVSTDGAGNFTSVSYEGDVSNCTVGSDPLSGLFDGTGGEVLYAQKAAQNFSSFFADYSYDSSYGSVFHNPVNGPGGVCATDNNGILLIGPRIDGDGSAMILNSNTTGWAFASWDIVFGSAPIGSFSVFNTHTGVSALIIEDNALENSLYIDSSGNLTNQGNPIVIAQDLSTSPVNSVTPQGWVPTTVNGSPAWLPYYV